MWKGNHLSIKGYTKGVNENVWAGHRGGGGGGGGEEPSSYETLLSAPFPPDEKPEFPGVGLQIKHLYYRTTTISSCLPLLV